MDRYIPKNEANAVVFRIMSRDSRDETKFTVEGGDSENGKNYARNNCVYYQMTVDFPYWCALNSVFSGFNTHVACR